MVTKEKAGKAGKTDKTVGPVTSSDMNQPAPKADPGAAPAAKTKTGKPEAITPSEHATELREARLTADAAKDDLRADMRAAEKKAGVEPTPVVPQGPSALRDWKVSANPDPNDVQKTIENSEKKQEVRIDHHR